MRTYWRSLAQVEDHPEFRAALQREFPEGASELTDGITRRDMMMLVGASLSLAGLAGCRRPVEEIVPYVAAPEDTVPGIPRYYATTMPFRRSAYGLIVESHEGRPTKIEGNPSHPTTLGASSARIQASVLGLYDPDRSQSVTLKGARKTWKDFVAAWEQLSQAHAADGGAGLAVLSESFASPTLARLVSDLRARYPRVQWATYDAISDENRVAGLAAATGRSLDLLLRLDRAAVILALDADPLLTDPEMVRHARGFAQGRRAGAASTLLEPQGRPEQGRGATGSGQAMNRLYSVEGVYSLTGAMADHRLRLESRQIAPFLATLAARLGAGGAASLAGAALPGVDPRWIDALAKDLLANRGKGVIVAGERQPASVHAAVCALNAFLGNTGATVSYYETKDAALPSVSSLDSLVSAMKAGTVQTLVVLGGNPVFDAPVDFDFASALSKVPHTIALGHSVDETSARVEWHIPRAHFLESWGDARAVGGTLGVVQPLILPLFDGRSPVELLGLMAGGQDRPGYDLVRETWKPILGEAEFDRKWNRVLHDGLLSGSELPEVAPGLKGEPYAELGRTIVDGASPQAAAGSAGALEVVFLPSPSLHDGRFANDGWLQELPDPLTKLTWDNPALVSPKTAETLGLTGGDVVRLDHAGRSLELPAWIVPGMADGVVALTLGYGRAHAGRVGSGVGFDTFTLRGSQASGFASGVTLTRLGRKHPLSATQEHGSMEGRPIVRESTLSELRAAEASSPAQAEGAHVAEAPHAGKEGRVPEAPGVFEEEPHHFSLWKEHTYDQGQQWGMTIDLNTCIGCNACMVACQSENNVPVVGKVQVAKGREMHWIRVDRYFSGEPSGGPEVVFQPVPCMHCEDAPCEQVCPVAATVHDAQGLNVMVYNRCIGTRYCSNNCPYKVRRFNFFNFTKDTPSILQLGMNPDVTVRARGVMEKCTYCTQRINRTKIDAKLAGRAVHDGDVKTACQQACPASAIEFGDLRDGSSRVAKAKADPRNYALLDELNTKPRTTYLAKVRNPNPDLDPSTRSGSSRAGSSDEGVA
ncbi:MAG TPA: TAT-variant-translocated molybdopterin oxidoreductase [Vicinamibacterales bacterium]|nr:TAT-variant-translocated molybdopterin oxidoreductase [Vicinamibacterales bacterium]